MDYVTEPRRLRRRRRPAPLLLLILAAVVVMGLLAAVVLSLRDRRSQPEPEADPHAGQVYVNDGANMVWLTPHEGFPVSALPQEDFRRDENEDGTPGQRVRYIGADYATRWGVDVSNYQGTIDWAALKAQGVEFAYLRIGLRGYGEAGTLYPDRSFVRYYEGAQAAGIDVGVYMFSQAATPLEAAEEALYVQQLLDGRELQLPVYYDWEPVLQEDSRTLDSSRLLLTAQARVFCELMEKSGYDAGVMTDDVLYFAHPVFSIYRSYGAVAVQAFVLNALRRFMGDEVPVKLEGMPTTGRVTLMRQQSEKRDVLHLLYANTVNRGGGGVPVPGETWPGRSIEVIEELTPIGPVRASVRAEAPVKSVTLVPAGTELPFEQKDGRVVFTVPEFTCHQMVELAY